MEAGCEDVSYRAQPFLTCKWSLNAEEKEEMQLFRERDDAAGHGLEMEPPWWEQPRTAGHLGPYLV